MSTIVHLQCSEMLHRVQLTPRGLVFLDHHNVFDGYALVKSYLDLVALNDQMSARDLTFVHYRCLDVFEWLTVKNTSSVDAGWYNHSALYESPVRDQSEDMRLLRHHVSGLDRRTIRLTDPDGNTWAR